MGLFASREEAAARLHRCFSCEHITKTSPQRCALCNCYMRAKVQLRSATCPKGYWSRGRFVANSESDTAGYWRHENSIIRREMACVPDEDKQYSLSEIVDEQRERRAP
jgi:hypothetical protein